MKDSIKYKTGVSGLNGSLTGSSEEALSTGFTDITPARLEPWDADFVRQDDGGTNQVGNRYDFAKTGACGRPNGDER